MYNQVDLAGLADGDIMYPGTNVRVIAVPGLTGTNRIVSSYLGNFFYGTDLLSDEEQFSVEVLDRTSPAFFKHPQLMGMKRKLFQ